MVFNSGYQEFKLDNGLHVVLQQTPTKTISGRLKVNHGALHEQRGEEGLAHFLEHALATGGSQKYSPEEADEIKANFGYFNAFTGLGITSFPFNILSSDLISYLSLVSDLAFYPRLDATRIDEERQRILREISDTKSNPAFRDLQAFNVSLLGEGAHTYFIPGNEDVVRNATPNDLRKFHSRGYHANNMDLVLVGGLPADIESLVRKYFDGMPTGGGRPFEFPPVPLLEKRVVLQRYSPELINSDNRDESNAAFYLGVIIPPETHEDSEAIHLMASVLGEDTSSRLFRAISQKKGLAYNIGISRDNTDNKGYLVISGRVLSKKQDEAIALIFEEIKALQREPIELSGLEMVKRKMMFGMAKIFETNEGHVRAIGYKLDTGENPEHILLKIGAVTPERIVEVANKYLPGSRDGNYVLMIRDPLNQ